MAHGEREEMVAAEGGAIDAACEPKPKMPLLLKVFGVLCIVGGAVSIPSGVLAVVVIVQFLQSGGLAEEALTPLAVTVVLVLAQAAMLVLFILLGVRLLRNKRRYAALTAEVLMALAAVALIVLFLTLFLRTRMGLAIRATGNNPDMVRSSSINPAVTTTIGLCIAGSFTALSGCLLAQYQKAADINIGQGMVTIALASLLIGSTVLGRGGILLRAVGAVLGAVIFRLVYTVALRLDMPAFMLKLVSAVIVVLAISIPYLRTRLPVLRRRMQRKAG